MSDEQYALSPAPSQPPPPTEADYEAIFAAVMETVRGRWFLSEFGRRNRQADTQIVLAAIERLESMVRGERADPSFERIRSDIREMAEAIAATKREIAAMRHDGGHKNIGEATEELDSIVMATERATSDILAAAETIQETAWTLREQGLDGDSSDKLDRCATDVYLACSFQDLTGQRTRKVIQVMRFLEGRINAMVGILGEDGGADEPPARASHAPLDIDMDQAEIDAVIPTTHAERADAAATERAPAPSLAAEPAMAAAMPEIEPADLPPSPTNAEGPIDQEPMAALAVSPEPEPFDTGDVVTDAASDRAERAPISAAEDEASVEIQLAGAATDLAAVAGAAEAVETSPAGDENGAEAAFLADGEAATAAAIEDVPAAMASVAADTKALMADLLAIIRPAGASDDSAETTQEARATQAGTEAAAAVAPPREDFRLMRPIAPGALSSDFVIVPLALEPAIATPAAADEAEAAIAPATVAMPTPEPDTAAVASEPAAAEIVEMAAMAGDGDRVVEAEAAMEITGLDNDLLMAADALAEPEMARVEDRDLAPQDLAPQDLAHQDLAPQELAPQELAPQELAPQDLAPQELAPQELAPQEPAPQELPPRDLAPAPASDLADIDSDLLLMSTDIVSAATLPEVDLQPETPAEAIDLDILAPLPDLSVVADEEGRADAGAIEEPAPPTEEIAAASEDIAAAIGDATAEIADRTAATDAIESETDTAADTAAGAAAEAPPAMPTTEERAPEPASGSVVLLPPVSLSAHAAAALAALAMSTPATGAEAATETAPEDLGHADPLAAVNALSVEERIALFS